MGLSRVSQNSVSLSGLVLMSAVADGACAMRSVDDDPKQTEALVNTGQFRLLSISHSPLRRLISLSPSAIQSGISHLTIHGRTRLQVCSPFALPLSSLISRLGLSQPSTHPVDLDAIAFATSLVGGRVPCVANGDVWTPEDVELTRQKTGCSGVMAAR